MSTIETQPSASVFLDRGASWDERRSHGHSVQFYEDDTFLLDGLSRFIGAAILGGDSAIVIATKSHREGLVRRLANGGLDLKPAIQQGRYLALDAAETLSKLMVDGWPDGERFSHLIGTLIAQLRSAAQAEHSRVAAFGEMVALLWAEGKPDAAIRLEQLWNDLAQVHSFQLHCAYPISFFSQEKDGGLVQKICSEHSHVVPTEGYTTLVSDEERRRNIIFLQQKAQALETEILERKRVQQALQRRETELSDFLENAVIGMHWVAADGTILWANKAELDLLGYKREEYVGQHISKFHADRDAIGDILERLTRNEELHGCKASLRCKDGSIRHVRIHSNVFMQDGKLQHTRCFTVDITDQARSERRIASQHAITRLLAEANSFAEVADSILQVICGASECNLGAVWQVDEQTQHLQCVKIWRSPQSDFSEFEKLTSSIRFEKGEGLPGRIWATEQPAWIPNVAADDNLPRRSLAIADGIHSAFGFPICTKEGVLGVIEFYARQIRMPDGEFMNMMAAIGSQIGQFIERKQADQLRLESERRMRLAQQVAGIGTFELNIETNVNRWTPELEAMHGLQPGGFAGTQTAWEELLHPDDRSEAMKQVAAGFETAGPVQGEWRVVWPDGSVHWIAGKWQVFKDDSGKPLRVTGVNIDITEQKRSEEASLQLAAIVESADDAIVSKDLNGIVASWNRAAERIFGYRAEEIVGRSILLIIPPELQDQEPKILAKLRAGERIEHFETVRCTKYGERLNVALTISPVKDQRGKIIGVAKIVRNITQQKKLEEALRTTEKLAAVGRLAATIAHEINNPLEAVTNFIYLAKQQPELPDKLRNYLERADKELGRVSHIAQQTLGFYRDNSRPVEVVVANAVEDVLTVYESRLKYKGLKIEKRIQPGLAVCTLQGELKQILSNLIANAIDASKEGGRILISGRASRHFQSGHHGIRITVADDGTGIAREYRQRLFTPFFTTKREIGTGLGLWITKDLLEKKGGHIRFRSRTETKSGTAIGLFIPVSGASSEWVA
jgi:PAS domain S-box-containing protein